MLYRVGTREPSPCPLQVGQEKRPLVPPPSTHRTVPCAMCAMCYAIGLVSPMQDQYALLMYLQNHGSMVLAQLSSGSESQMYDHSSQ